MSHLNLLKQADTVNVTIDKRNVAAYKNGKKILSLRGCNPYQLSMMLFDNNIRYENVDLEWL